MADTMGGWCAETDHKGKQAVIYSKNGSYLRPQKEAQKPVHPVQKKVILS